jgi:hypothetical protein
VEEVKNVEETCDIWWCEDAIKQPEWTKVDISNAYSQYLIVEKQDKGDKKLVINCSNHYDVLYESDDDDSLINTKGTFGDSNKYEGEDMDFVIPSCYSYTPQSAFNIEVVEEEKHKVYACEHENKNSWREEWLLNSGLMVNLTNKKEHLWEQHKTNIMVTKQNNKIR